MLLQEPRVEWWQNSTVLPSTAQPSGTVYHQLCRPRIWNCLLPNLRSFCCTIEFKRDARTRLCVNKRTEVFCLFIERTVNSWANVRNVLWYVMWLDHRNLHECILTLEYQCAELFVNLCAHVSYAELIVSHVTIIWSFAPQRGALKVAYSVSHEREAGVFAHDKVGCRRIIVNWSRVYGFIP